MDLLSRWKKHSQCGDVFHRPLRSAQRVQPEGHQHDSGRWRPGDGLSQLDSSRGARHPRAPLQSLLELDRYWQVCGAVQEEEEEDHQRGNLSPLFR